MKSHDLAEALLKLENLEVGIENAGYFCYDQMELGGVREINTVPMKRGGFNPWKDDAELGPRFVALCLK